jgi:hypothetical protein
MARTIEQPSLDATARQSTDDCLGRVFYRVRNARSVGGLVCFDDNLSVPHEEQAV